MAVSSDVSCASMPRTCARRDVGRQRPHGRAGCVWSVSSHAPCQAAPRCRRAAPPPAPRAPTHALRRRRSRRSTPQRGWPTQALPPWPQKGREGGLFLVSARCAGRPSPLSPPPALTLRPVRVKLGGAEPRGNTCRGAADALATGAP
jgi:hypothetical protein